MHKVDAMLANATTFYKLPGLVAVVTLGKTKAWFKGYGKRDARVDDSPPPSVRPLQARLLAAPLPTVASLGAGGGEELLTCRTLIQSSTPLGSSMPEPAAPRLVRNLKPVA